MRHLPSFIASSSRRSGATFVNPLPSVLARVLRFTVILVRRNQSIHHAAGNIPFLRRVFSWRNRIIYLDEHPPDLDIATSLLSCSSSAEMVYIRHRVVVTLYPLLTLTGLNACNELQLRAGTATSPLMFCKVASFAYLTIDANPLYLHHFTLLNWSAKYGFGDSMYHYLS